MDASSISSENLHYLSNMRPDMPHKLDMVNGPVDHHSFSENSEDFKWRHEAVMLLCSLYRSKKEQFVSGFVKKRDLWAEVATEMVSQGFPVNYIACEKKWHNLCATFRKLREFNRYSAKKRKCWAFYETLEEILTPDSSSDRHDHVKCESPENSCHTPNASGLNPVQMSMYGKSMWPVPYRHQSVETAHADGRPRSCEQDITSMLSVTLEENNHSQGSVNNTAVHNGMAMSSQICVDDFKWTHNSVMLLCSMYISRKDQFLSGTVKKRDLWSDIAQQMNQEGFPVTFTGCEKKWHNLIATYKKVVLYNKKKTWPYLHIFQKIIEEQQGNRIFLNTPEYGHTLPGSSYNKDCADNSLCVKISVKDDVPLLSSNTPVLYADNLNNSNDSMDDFKWTHDSVISLCTLYKERRDDFISNTVRKRDLWTEVANEMNVQGYCVTWVHCEKKWYNLYATFKKVTDHNRKRVRIWSTWPYLQLFQDIFNKDASNGRGEQSTGMNNSYETEPGASHEICSPSPSNSDRTCDMPQEQMAGHSYPPSKRLCVESPPVWFLEYCERQREQEEQRHIEMEQRHRELLGAIMRGNDVVKELSENLKMFLNKCL